MAVRTQFTDLYFLDPVGDVVTEVGCVTTLSGLTAARDQIETTCLNDTARTYEPGMPTPGAATFGINFDPADDSHVRLHELYVAGTKVDWALGWGDYALPRGPGLGPVPTVSSGGLAVPGTRSWMTFNGYVSDLPFDFALNSVVSSTVSVQVSDFPILVRKT